MFIFVWKSTEKEGAHSLVFSATYDAADWLTGVAICQWPDVILDDNGNTYVPYLDFANKCVTIR
jgi:hypothetical protein